MHTREASQGHLGALKASMSHREPSDTHLAYLASQSTSMARPAVQTWWSTFRLWQSGENEAVRDLYARRKGRWDEFKLWQMGYKQEMPRSYGWLHNFGCGLSVMTVFALCEAYTIQGLLYGGPVVVIWGWIAVGLLTLCIALSMAELLSAFPTAGGLYYWAWVLAPTSYRGMMCWMTGFMNLMGQVAFTAIGELLLTQVVVTLILMHTIGQDGSPGYLLTPVQTMLVFAGFTMLHAIMNTLSQSFTAVCMSFSAIWNVVAPIAYMVVLLLVAPTHQSHKFVWSSWQPNTDITGISSGAYIVAVGLLFAQTSMTGYDVIVNISEETVDADVEGSWAIPSSVLASLLLGLGLLLGMTYSMQSESNLFDVKQPCQGRALAQLTWDVFQARYGNGRGSVPMMYLPAVGMFFCAFVIMTSGSRMLYAFSRDGAMFGARYWRAVGRNQLPVAATWLMAALTFIFGVATCWNLQLWNTLAAIAVVCLALSFGIPIALWVWRGPAALIPGPFRLGRWSRPVGFIACTWIVTSVVIFCLPNLYPLDPKTFNYTPAVLGVLILAAFASWWAPGFGAVHWFKGPRPNVTGHMEAPVNLSHHRAMAVANKLSHHTNTVAAMSTIHESNSVLAYMAEEEDPTSHSLGLPALNLLLDDRPHTLGLTLSQRPGRPSLQRGSHTRGTEGRDANGDAAHSVAAGATHKWAQSIQRRSMVMMSHEPNLESFIADLGAEDSDPDGALYTTHAVETVLATQPRAARVRHRSSVAFHDSPMQEVRAPGRSADCSLEEVTALHVLPSLAGPMRPFHAVSGHGIQPDRNGPVRNTGALDSKATYSSSLLNIVGRLIQASASGSQARAAVSSATKAGPLAGVSDFMQEIIAETVQDPEVLCPPKDVSSMWTSMSNAMLGNSTTLSKLRRASTQSYDPGPSCRSSRTFSPSEAQRTSMMSQRSRRDSSRRNSHASTASRRASQRTSHLGPGARLMTSSSVNTSDVWAGAGTPQQLDTTFEGSL